MEYTVNKLAKLASISTRTLRYYDELGLLPAARVSSNGYRIYGRKEVDRLQQILFYRELGVPLDEIKRIVLSADFDGMKALKDHLTALLAKREQLSLLIANVEKTILAGKGEAVMSDKEKFDGFINKLVDDNEREYGTEIREKYGDDTVNRSNAKVRKMTKEQYAEVEALSLELNEAIKEAYGTGDPSSGAARKMCEMHKKWLCYFWDSYSPEAHMGVTQMYVDDPRFTGYYDKIASGSAVFMRDAVKVFCS